MFAQFRYLDGARAGETSVVGNDFATIGRHPTSDVGFDAEAIGVSMRHAAVFKQGGGFMIRDLGSTNGTFVNDRRVRGDRPLEPNDVIRLGPTGPKVEFATTPTMPVAPKPRPAPPTAPPLASTEIYRPRARTTEPVLVARAPTKPARRPWRWAIGALLVAGAGTAGLLTVRAREARAEVERRRALLLTRIDEHLNRIGSPTTPVAVVATAIGSARAATDQFRATVERGAVSAATLDTLDRTLTELIRTHEPVLRAARFDPAAAAQRGRISTAVVIGEVRGAAAQSGTGFVVKRAGDTVWLATVRSVVVDSIGRPSPRIAVIFNGAVVAHLATLVRADDSTAVALLVATGRIAAPEAVTLRDSAALGDPVAAVGFPTVVDSLGDWRRSGVAATVVAGTVISTTSAAMAVAGFGAPGPRGAPLFAESGEVIGMVTGTVEGRWLVTPTRAIRRLLDAGR